MAAITSDYTLLAGDSGFRRYRNITLLLVLLAALIFLTSWLQNRKPIFLILTILELCICTWMFFRYRKNEKMQFTGHWVLMVTGILLLVLPPVNFIGLLYLLLAFISTRISRPVLIQFSDEGISIRAVIRSRYTWQELLHVILKDGLLTVELPGDKIIQREITLESLPDESEFNNYIAEKLGATHNHTGRH